MTTDLVGAAEALKSQFRADLIAHVWELASVLEEVTAPSGKKYMVEVRQPTMRQRGKILAKAGATSKAEDQDLSAMVVHAAVACSFFPGTNVSCFDPHEAERLMQLPAGCYVDQLGNRALKLMNVEAPEAAKKSESPATPSSSA